MALASRHYVLLISFGQRQQSANAVQFFWGTDPPALILRRGIESSERLGKHRWVAERTHGWFSGFGKLRIRFEKPINIQDALLTLAAAIICARFVDRWC